MRILVKMLGNKERISQVIIHGKCVLQTMEPVQVKHVNL